MRLRKLLAALMVASMVLGLIGSAAFAQGNEQALYDEAVEMLREFGIVQGDAGTGELRPNDSITRAEMIKVLVTAAGQGETAALLAGAPAFSDSQNHWASGYIALAKNMGLTTGYPDGTFRPDAEVTYAEVVALLTRLAGVQPAAGTWPMNYIQAANDAGINAANMDLAGLANAAAVRGAVFVLSHSAFMNVTDSSGKNVYQKSFDSNPPTITVDAVASPTEAASVTVSGKVSDAVAAFVSGSAVELAADGSFSADVDLKVGANEIVITALDKVGNEGSATVAIERINAPAAAIEANAIEVVAGESVEVGATVKDQNGAAIEGAEITGEVAPEGLGTFAAGTFTAGTTAGTGTLTLSYGEVSTEVNVIVVAGALEKITVVPSKSVAAPGEMVNMTVKGEDAHGNEVSVDGATFSFEGADALINPSTGAFIASKAGSYTITATVGEISGTATVGIYGDVASLKVEGPAEAIGNNKTDVTLTVIALDENGNQVALDGKVFIGFDDTAVEVRNSSGTKLNDEDAVSIKGGTATIKVRGLDGAIGALTTINAYWDSDEDGSLDVAEKDDIKAKHTVEIIEQVATSLKVTAPKYVSANTGDEDDSVDVTVEVMDQAGVKMLSGAWDVEWQISGPARQRGGTKISGTDVTTGQAFTLEVQPKQGETGTVTVTFTMDGVGSASGTVQAAVAGSAAKLEVEVDEDEITADDSVAGDNVATITIRVTDKTGVPVAVTTDTPLQIVFDDDKLNFNGGGGRADVEDIAGDDADVAVNGTKAHQIDVTLHSGSSVKVPVSLNRAGQKSFTVKDPAGDLSSATGSISVTPADAAQIGWTRDLPLVFAVNSPKGSATLQLYDEFNNKVAKADVEIEVTGKDGDDETDEISINGTAKKKKVKTDANGQATVEIETRPYTTGRDYNVEFALPAGYNPKSAPSLAIQVLANPPARMTVALKQGGVDVTSVDAGEAVEVVVNVYDQFDAKLAGFEDQLDVELAKGEWDLNNDPDSKEDGDAWPGFAPSGANGTDYVIAAGNLTARQAARITFTVKLDLGGTVLTASDSVRVRAGNPHHVVVSEATGDTLTAGEIKLDKGTVKAFTLRLADEWGNMVTADQTYYVGPDLVDVPSQVTVRLATDGTNIADMDGDFTGETKDDLIPVRTSKTIYLLVGDWPTGVTEQTVVLRGTLVDSNGDPMVGAELEPYTLTIKKP